MKLKNLSFAVLLFLAAAGFAAPLKIGWATADVSTDKPIFLQGLDYRRVSQGLRDPITVTALAIDNGKDCVIFNSWDTSCVYGNLAKRVRDGVAKKLPGFPVEKIVFNAIHTHTGPALGVDYNDPLSVEYRNMFIEKTVDTIVRAWNERKPGKIGYGYDFAVTCFSRRTVYFDDLRKRPPAKGKKLSLWKTIPGLYSDKYVTMHGNADDPMFSHMEAAPDPFVNFLFTYDMNDKLTGMIFNVAFPAHISISDLKLGSDCWSDIRREVKKDFGDVYVLAQCAAAGDLTHKIPYYKKATDRKYRLMFGREEAYKGEFERHRITEQLMAALHRTLPWASKALYCDLPLRHICTTLQLPRFYAKPEHIEEAKANRVKLEEMKKNPPWDVNDPVTVKKANGLIGSAEYRIARVLKLNDSIKKKPNWAMEFHVLRIGEVAFVSERYELYTDFGQRIQARSPFTQTFTIQLSAGLPDLPTFNGGYLPTAVAVGNAGYQAHPINNANSPSPEGGQQMVDEAVRLLYELKKDDEKSPQSVEKK